MSLARGKWNSASRKQQYPQTEHYCFIKNISQAHETILCIATLSFTSMCRSYHRDYQQRVAAATAQNAALLEDP